jgi:hypothetical protein
VNMVLTPRIAGTNVVPNGGGRYAAGGAAFNADYSAVNELNQTGAIIYEGDSEFQYDQFSAKQHYQQREQNQYNRQQNFDHFGRLFEQTLERPISMSMLGTTSESFAAAFETSEGNDIRSNGAMFSYQPSYTLDTIIDTYETNAKVIYGEIPPKGDKLNVVL